MKRKSPEAGLQKCVVSLLKLYATDNTLFFSVPNEGRRSKRTGAELKAMGLRVGCGDLCVITGGKAAFLELKSAKGRQTKAQREFEAECKSMGIPYTIARTPEEAADILWGWRAISVNPLRLSGQLRLVA